MLDPVPDRKQLQEQELARQREREQVYGYGLMSLDELHRYREQLRAAASDDEREMIRSRHREEMLAREREMPAAPLR